VIEGGIELRASDLDTRGTIVGDEAVEPMARAVEGAAEIKEDSFFHWLTLAMLEWPAKSCEYVGARGSQATLNCGERTRVSCVD
jgi:hypothetical protein